MPFDWKAQGFLVGQPVHISGFAGLSGPSSASPTTTRPTRRTTRACTCAGPILTPAQIDAAPSRRSSRRDRSAAGHVAAVPAAARSRARPATGSPTASSVGQRVTIERRRRRVDGAARSRNGDTTLVLDRRAGARRRRQRDAHRLVGRAGRHRGRRAGRRRRSRSRSSAATSAATSPAPTAAPGPPRLHGGPAGDDPGPRGRVARAPHRGRRTAETLRLERGAVLPTIATPTTRRSTGPARTAA